MTSEMLSIDQTLIYYLAGYTNDDLQHYRISFHLRVLVTFQTCYFIWKIWEENVDVKYLRQFFVTREKTRINQIFVCF